MLFDLHTHLFSSLKFYTIYIKWVEFESIKRIINTWGTLMDGDIDFLLLKLTIML
jgi:hypothetical protein